MSASNKPKKPTPKSAAANLVKEFDGDVLFQKIFDKWYAFSVVDGECMMTEVPEAKIPHFRQNVK